MAQAAIAESPIDTGVASLCLIAASLGISADPREILLRDIPGGIEAGDNDLVRAARKLGLKARLIATKWKYLHRIPLPAIACLEDGAYMVASRFIDGRMLVQFPTRGRPHLLDAAEFNYFWNGKLIVLKRPAAAPAVPTFNIGWFLLALHGSLKARIT